MTKRESNRGKKGEIEIAEIGKIVIAVVVLVLMSFAVFFLLKGKGGSILDAIKNAVHIGRFFLPWI